MIHARLLVLILIGALSGAMEASAREVVFGVEQSITGDSNLFSNSFGNQADGSYRVGPTIRLREDRKEINYDFYYGPNYQVYFVTDDVNGWNQDFRGDLTYNPSPRDEIKLVSRAHLNRFVSTLIEDPSGTAGVNAPGLGDQGRYHVDLSYERGFSARSFGYAGATYDQLTYSNTFNVPNISGRARVGGSHLVHPQWLVGANAEGTFRKFEQTIRSGPTTRTGIVNINATARWTPYQTVTVSGSIGPSWVKQRQEEPGAITVPLFLVPQGSTFAATYEGCAEITPGVRLFGFGNCSIFGDGSSVPTLFDTTQVDFLPGAQTTAIDSSFVTFFARFFVRQDWNRGGVQAGYVRTQDATGGTASTTIADTVSLSTNYRPVRRTILGFHTRFTRRRTNATRTRGLPTAERSGEFATPGSLPPGADPELASASNLVLVESRDRSERRELYITATGSRRITQNLSMRGEFSFVTSWSQFRQFDIATGQPLVDTDGRFTRFIGRLVVTYEFDPYRF